MYSSLPIRVAINGFGRIGRNVAKLLISDSRFKLIAVNDLADTKTLSHLLKYDSIHGVLPHEVTHTAQHIIVNSHTIEVSHYEDPIQCKWSPLDIDIVIEATGKFKTYDLVQKHILAGAKKVILSAPPLDDKITTIVLGVNDHLITGSEQIISNASCTTNNAAPMIKTINELCGIEQAYITTIHSYTTDQSLHDQPHKDLRRARAAGQSIVPTTTGAAKALTKIFPELRNVIGGCGIRVPVPNGSLTDITFNVKNEISITEINTAFRKASQTTLQGILAYTEDPIVSIDVKGNPHSCIFDALMTSAIGKMVKIIGWYDNELGYSNRIIDLAYKICNK